MRDRERRLAKTLTDCSSGMDEDDTNQSKARQLGEHLDRVFNERMQRRRQMSRASYHQLSTAASAIHTVVFMSTCVKAKASGPRAPGLRNEA